MSAIPNFAASPRVSSAVVSVANPNRNGSGTIADVLTAGASGSRIDTVCIKATSTSTAGMIRLFINNNSTSVLIAEIPVTAITPSATTPSYQAVVSGVSNPDLFPLVLPTGYKLQAATEKAESFNVIAIGGNF